MESERDELLGKIEEYDAYVQVTATSVLTMSQPALLCLPHAVASVTPFTSIGSAQGVRDYEVEVRANMDAMEAERARCAPGSITWHACFPHDLCNSRHCTSSTSSCRGYCRQQIGCIDQIT